MVGTYSSIFFATPLLVTMRERTELVRNHTRRVLNRRNRSAAPSELATEVVAESVAASVGVPADKPAPGARPVRSRRHSGKHER